VLDHTTLCPPRWIWNRRRDDIVEVCGNPGSPGSDAALLSNSDASPRRTHHVIYFDEAGG
jgi:hypothetical protein